MPTLAETRLSPDDLAIPGPDLLVAGEQLMTFPIVMMMAWWEAIAGFWLPTDLHHLPHDHQLPVPDPIEHTGEHALFA